MALADEYGERLYLRQERHEYREALRAALTEALAPDPVIGSKTWMENGVIMMQDLTVSDIYQPPHSAHPVREPLTDAWIRERTKQPWVFETVKTWVREIEREHGIGVSK